MSSNDMSTRDPLQLPSPRFLSELDPAALTELWRQNPERQDIMPSEAQQMDVEEYREYLMRTPPQDVTNAARLLERAKEGGRYRYRYLIAQEEGQLLSGIRSHLLQVDEHERKIRDPAKYDKEAWDAKDERAKRGLLIRWRKDQINNLREAYMEIAVAIERRIWDE